MTELRQAPVEGVKESKLRQLGKTVLGMVVLGTASWAVSTAAVWFAIEYVAQYDLDFRQAAGLGLILAWTSA
jgi:Fe-S cluster assembly ATPase SufC